MNEPTPMKRQKSTGWSVAVAIGVIMVIGITAAELIPAFAGVKNSAQFHTFNTIVVFGLLGFFLRKQKGLSGGIGWLVGGLVGLVVTFGGSFIQGYQKARLANEAELQAAHENMATINADLPQMVTDEVRADRVDFNETEMVFYLTFVDAIADELDLDQVREEYRGMYVSVLCDTEETQGIVDVGADFHYYFVDKSGDPVMDFVLNQSDCQ